MLPNSFRLPFWEKTVASFYLPYLDSPARRIAPLPLIGQPLCAGNEFNRKPNLKRSGRRSTRACPICGCCGRDPRCMRESPRWRIPWPNFCFHQFGCVAEEMPSSPQSTSFASPLLCVDWWASYKVLLVKNLISVVIGDSKHGTKLTVIGTISRPTTNHNYRLTFQACRGAVPIARIAGRKQLLWAGLRDDLFQITNFIAPSVKLEGVGV